MLFKPQSAFLGRPVRRPTGSPAHRPVEPPADRLTRRPERRLLLEVYDDATDTKGSRRGKNLQTQGKESANAGETFCERRGNFVIFLIFPLRLQILSPALGG